jgi:hypothetical protein
MHEVFQSGLGEYQVSGDKDCREQSIGIGVLAYLFVVQRVITRLA